MPSYTVHVRPGATQSAAADQVVFVPETFSKGAFVTGPFWFIAARAWRALMMWLIAFGALAAVAIGFRLNPEIVLVLALIGQILTGLEANNLWRGALERRGFRFVDVASGEHIEDVEWSYFRRWRSTGPTVARPAAASAASAPSYAQVGGLFPDAGG